MRNSVRNFVFNTSKNTEFCFYCYIELVSVVNNLLRKSDVFFERKVRSVDHHRAKAHVDAALASFEAITVVEVKYDFRMCATKFLSVSYSTFSHVAEKSLVCVFTSTLRNLEDHGALLCSSSLNDSLELLHVVEVESGDSVATLYGTSEHIASIHEAEVFVINHNCMS